MTITEPSLNPQRTQETRGRHWQGRRLFVGPLPDKLSAVMHEMTQATDRSFDASYVSAVRDVLDRNARAFFLRQGGRAEDWDEEAHENVRDELMRRWQECPWTLSLRRTHRAVGVTHWVGTSFEVGSILCVNVLDNHVPTPAPSVVPEVFQQESHVPYASTTALSSTGPRSYWTAQSHLSSPSPQSAQGSASSSISLPEQHGGELSAFSSGSPLLATASTPAFATKHLPQQGSDAPRSILKHPTGPSSRKPRTKRRGVSLLDRDAKRKVSLRPRESGSSLIGADSSRVPLDVERAGEGPVPPAAVLARTGSEVVGCSAGATADTSPSQAAPGDIFLRGLWNSLAICVTLLTVSKIECLLGCVTPCLNPFQYLLTRFKIAKQPIYFMKIGWSFWSCGGGIG